jgi:ABC-type multidrug transport system ATPase subunit
MSKPLISLERLVKRFGDTIAVDGVTMAINRGEIFGFLESGRFRGSAVHD